MQREIEFGRVWPLSRQELAAIFEASPLKKSNAGYWPAKRQELGKMSVVVLMGGGIDSTALLLYARGMGHTCHALHIDYGQKAAERELEACLHFTGRHNAGLRQIRLPLEQIANADILQNAPAGTNRLEGRNMIFGLMAATYAITMGARSVLLGFHREPPGTAFPDATMSAAAMLHELIGVTYSQYVNIWVPFGDWKREQILDFGTRSDPDFLTHTHTCYENVPGGCGECVHCKQRAVMIYNLANPKDAKPLPENF